MYGKDLRDSRRVYVNRLREAGNGILHEAYRLQGLFFDDIDDLQTLQDIARVTEDLAADMGELMEDVWVLAQDFGIYLDEQDSEETLT